MYNNNCTYNCAVKRCKMILYNKRSLTMQIHQMDVFGFLTETYKTHNCVQQRDAKYSCTVKRCNLRLYVGSRWFCTENGCII